MNTFFLQNMTELICQHLLLVEKTLNPVTVAKNTGYRRNQSLASESQALANLFQTKNKHFKRMKDEQPTQHLSIKVDDFSILRSYKLPFTGIYTLYINNYIYMYTLYTHLYIYIYATPPWKVYRFYGCRPCKQQKDFWGGTQIQSKQLFLLG